MNIERIEQEWQEWAKKPPIVPGLRLSVLFAEHIATLARNEALEEAAQYVDSKCTPRGDAIRTMKNMPDQSKNEESSSIIDQLNKPIRTETINGLTLEYDIIGGVNIKIEDFVYVRVNYDHRYTHNAARKELAEKIAGLISGKEKPLPEPICFASTGVLTEIPKTRLVSPHRTEFYCVPLYQEPQLYAEPPASVQAEEYSDALRSLVSYVVCGGYNADDPIDAKVFEEKIRYGIDLMLATQANMSARKHLSDDEILDIGYAAGFHLDTIEDDETGEGSYGFINSDGEVDNEVFFKFARLVEKRGIKEQE